MGLFKPTWKSSNREKALKAIEKLTDQKDLEKAALTAPDPVVREEAAKKVTDLFVLVKIIQSDSHPDVAVSALAQLNDVKSLAMLVLSGKTGIIQSAALEKITDQGVLRDIMLILSSDPKKISDHNWIRTKTLEKITDQNALAQIARTMGDEQVIFEAACKLTDDALAQRFFLFLTRSDNIQMRFDAAEKLSDKNAKQQVYFKILSNRFKSGWHEAALKRLTDPALLSEAAKIITEPKMRLKIAEKLPDGETAQEIFSDVAQNATQNDIRLRAADRLNDQQIAQSVYIAIAKNAPSVFVRVHAAKKIVDQKTLYEIAKTDTEPDVQKAAVENMTDQNLLLDLFNSTKDHFFKQAVCERIGHDWDRDTGCKTCRKCKKEIHVGSVDEKDAGGHAVTQTCTACGRTIGYYYTDW